MANREIMDKGLGVRPLPPPVLPDGQGEGRDQDEAAARGGAAHAPVRRDGHLRGDGEEEESEGHDGSREGAGVKRRATWSVYLLVHLLFLVSFRRWNQTLF